MIENSATDTNTIFNPVVYTSEIKQTFNINEMNKLYQR